MYLDPKDGDTGMDADTGMDTLVQSLQDQSAHLRQGDEDRQEEARRKDTILSCFSPLTLSRRTCFTLLSVSTKRYAEDLAKEKGARAQEGLKILLFGT